MNENAIDRKLVCAFIDGLISDDGERKKGLEYIRSMPPVTPQPKTGQEKQAESEKYQKAFDDGYENGYAQARVDYDQEPCEDAISRQAVIDSLHSKFADGFDSDRWWNSMSVLYAINKVPPVNPTKTGYWIGVDGKPSHLQDGMTTGSVWCSLCGKWLTASDEYSCFGKYCPNCGARMIEPQERSDKE